MTCAGSWRVRMFSRARGDGSTVAQQYARHGIHLKPASMDRLKGWAEVQQGFGDPENEVRPTLLHPPAIQANGRNHSGAAARSEPAEDVLKVDADEEGVGGNDAADALRYLVTTKSRAVVQRKL